MPTTLIGPQLFPPFKNETQFSICIYDSTYLVPEQGAVYYGKEFALEVRFYYITAAAPLTRRNHLINLNNGSYNAGRLKSTLPGDVVNLTKSVNPLAIKF